MSEALEQAVVTPATHGEASRPDDVFAAYDAVRGGEAAGLIDLSSRGRIEVGGAEAVQFLNGLITNDVKALDAGAWMPAAFPNVQGRLLAPARVVNRGGGAFLIDTEAATRAAVFASLERFSLAGDFRVADKTDDTAQLSVQGACASKILEEVLGAEAAWVERGRVAQIRWRDSDLTVIRATHTAEDGLDIFLDSAEAAPALWDALSHAGARPVGFEALEILRVEAGLPRYGVDVSDANVVLEAGLGDDAVSFTKGCYVGQEIIARIHWRGHVAKRLAGLILDGGDATPATRGAKVFAAEGEREIGRVTSSVFSPLLERAVALAVVKYDFLKPETAARVVSEEGIERAARVAELPHVRGSWFAPDDADATAAESA